MPTSNTIANSGPRPVEYLFIDGAFLDRIARDFARQFEPDSNIKIDYARLSRNYERTIFYDALPVRKSNQTQEAFSEKFEAKRRYFGDLRKIPNFHVRDGYTRNRPNADSHIEQKGVDTWIAVDVLLYALRGNIDVAQIYTSDLDLYPMFEALLQTNTRGILRYDAARTSEELIQAADQSIPISQTQLFSMMPPDFTNKYKTVNIVTPAKGESKFVQASNGLYGDCVIRFFPEEKAYYGDSASVGTLFRSKSLRSIMRHLNECWDAGFEYDAGLEQL